MIRASFAWRPSRCPQIAYKIAEYLFDVANPLTGPPTRQGIRISSDIGKGREQGPDSQNTILRHAPWNIENHETRICFCRLPIWVRKPV